jgi:hypothetical protein
LDTIVRSEAAYRIRQPWNKGKLIGAKPPLVVETIRRTDGIEQRVIAYGQLDMLEAEWGQAGENPLERLFDGDHADILAERRARSPSARTSR